jgi:hypothetical protein
MGTNRFGIQQDSARSRVEGNAMGNRVHLSVRSRALLTGVLCGLAGMAVDVDHLPEYFLHIQIRALFVIPRFFDGPRFTVEYRPLHSVIFYISCAAVALIGGLLLRNSLISSAGRAAKSQSQTTQQANDSIPASEYSFDVQAQAKGGIFIFNKKELAG